MPKLSERERLAELEARQRRVAEEIETARRALRGRYAVIAQELPVEQLSERMFREIVSEAIRLGGDVALAALRSLTPPGEPDPDQPKPTRRVVPAASTAQPRAAGQEQQR